MKTDRNGGNEPREPGEHLKNNTMEINNNDNNINNNNLERSEPWARRCLDGECGHVGDVLCAKRIAVDGWHESVEEDRLMTPEEYNQLGPSIAEEFVKRWLTKMGGGTCSKLMADSLRTDAKHLTKAWEEWKLRGANAGPTCDKCGEDRNAIGGRVCWTCDLDMPQFEYKKVGHYHSLPICYCMVGSHEEEEEEDQLEQLAQATINGKYTYELYYNRNTQEVQVEIDSLPVYYYYPDTTTILQTFAKLLNHDEFELRIDSIFVNGKEATDTEIDEVYDKSWNYHIGLGRLLQFNISIVEDKDYDDGNQPPRRTHDDGFDEYDYEDEEVEEERRQEMAENAERQMEAYEEELLEKEKSE
jgi:hypothetical protein